MDTEKLLQEIFQLDPSLQSQEDTIRKSLKKIMKAKPDVAFDEDFKQNLISELLTLASEKNHSSFNLSTFMKNLSYIFGAGILAALAIVPFVSTPNTDIAMMEKDPTPQIIVENTSADDFDFLAEDGDITTADIAEGGRGGVQTSKMSILPYPRQNNFSYNYTGGSVELTEAELPVIKVKNVKTKALVNSVFKTLNISQMDIEAFSNLHVGSVNFLEDRDNGYSISVDFHNGNVSINKNWARWDQDRTEKFVINKDEVKESELIKIADDFVKKYGIDISHHGKAELEENMEIILQRAYKPENYRIVYPLLVDGTKVVNQQGGMTGIFVNVDLRTGSVSDVHGFESQSYESKKYPAMTDFSPIQKFLEQDNGNSFVFEEKEKGDFVKLAQPERVWMQYFRHGKGEAKQYLVPALVFTPYDTKADDWAQNKKVVVPLIQDMFDKASK
ncbi:hypothetical protein COB57_01880 [Candidatus Peregrinibacteria bacterium]|nr:MAG: hypothetical protein COB57_01880 [Candidatus Peregrinibacteria bacterium]